MCCSVDSNISSRALASTDPVRIDATTILMNSAMPIATVPRRRVSFQTAVNETYVAASSDMTQDERNELWYKPSDLSQFKSDARDICRLLKEEGMVGDILLDVELSNSNCGDCTRGLEHRISIERQKNKYITMRAILKAQQRYSKPEQLAHVAIKCTAWAKEVALVTGYQDFYQAYNPSLVHIVPFSITTKFPILSKKRSLEIITDSESSDNEQTCKRYRVQSSPIPMIARVA